MKKKYIWVLAAILICGASVFVSCVDASDNPVPVTGKYPITVKEGGAVTQKVTVSPSSASVGQTVTLTAAKGYKFRKVEVDNAPVTTIENGKLIINKTLFTVPIAWLQEDNTYLIADELPGFKAITAEEAAQWVPTEEDKENGAYLIYGFDKDGNMLYYATIFGADPVAGDPGKMPHNNMSSISNGSTLHVRFYYTSSATVIGDKTTATFLMPAGAANVDVDMVRDMSVDVTATMKATEFSLKKESDGFVLTEGEGLTAILPDVYDEFGAPLVEMQESIDYTLQLQKKDKNTDKWDDVKTLSEGTFRWLITGIDSYDGTIYSATFTLAVESNLNVAQKIIGKWMVSELDGELCPTNWKTVLTFESPTKAYGSLSDYFSESWNERVEAEVKINGNKVSVVNQKGNTKHVLDCVILSISDTDMLMSSDWTVYVDGKSVQHEVYGKERYVKVNTDYKDTVLGIWEGKSTGAEGSEFDDGENHRWEYLADGTFRYYHKVDGQWQMSDDVLHDYFVDGALLCTRWQNAGEGQKENREWWEIESIQNGVMKWTALRMREDGTTYTATFEMTKVQ